MYGKKKTSTNKVKKKKITETLVKEKRRRRDETQHCVEHVLPTKCDKITCEKGQECAIHSFTRLHTTEKKDEKRGKEETTFGLGEREGEKTPQTIYVHVC